MNTKVILFVILLLFGVGHVPALTIDALGSSMGTEVIIQEEDKNDNGLIDVLFVGAEFDIQENVNLDIYVYFYENIYFELIYEESRHFFIDQMGVQDIFVDIQGSDLYELNYTVGLEVVVEAYIVVEDGSSSSWFSTDISAYYLDFNNFDPPAIVVNSHDIYFEDIYNYDTQSQGTDGLYDVIVVEISTTATISSNLNMWGNVYSTWSENDVWYDDHAYNYDDNLITKVGINIFYLYFAPGNLFNMSDSVELQFDISFELYESDTQGYWNQLFYTNYQFNEIVDGTQFAPRVYHLTSSIGIEYIDSDSSGLYDQIEITFGLMAQIPFRLNIWMEIYVKDSEDYYDNLANHYEDFEISAGLQTITLTFESVYLGQNDYSDNLFLQFGGEVLYNDDKLNYYLSIGDIQLDVSTDEFDLAPVYFDPDSFIIEGRNYDNTLEAPYDYLYASIVLIVNEAAQVDTWFNINLINNQWFDAYQHNFYEIGTYGIEFGISGAKLYDTHVVGESWCHFAGYVNSDSLDFQLNDIEMNYYFDSEDFKSDGEYTDTMEGDRTDDDDGQPTLDLPSPSLYLSIFGFVAIVVIRKKRY
jgi:hypothetical protein